MITIYHKTHGEAHCHPSQLDDFKSEGWTTTKPKARSAAPAAEVDATPDPHDVSAAESLPE